MTIMGGCAERMPIRAIRSGIRSEQSMEPGAIGVPGAGLFLTLTASGATLNPMSQTSYTLEPTSEEAGP